MSPPRGRKGEEKAILLLLLLLLLGLGMQGGIIGRHQTIERGAKAVRVYAITASIHREKCMCMLA